MTRFFVQQVEGGSVDLSREDSHHLLRVMRAQPGHEFTVLAGGMEYQCRLNGVEDGAARGEVVAVRPALGEPPVRLTLFQGLAKGDKLETVIQHGTEIGITAFVPVATARSVVKLDAKKAAEKVERWQRIAREAAEQCRRGAVPRVYPVASWKKAVAQAADFDLALVPWEEGGKPLRQVLTALRGVSGVWQRTSAETIPGEQRAPRSIAVYIGPEGGLTPDEVELALRYGSQTVTLGPRILRTETAGLAAAAAILYELGDLG